MAGAPASLGGPNAVQNPAALVSALQAQAPPTNPSTPLERLNPDEQALEQVKSASVSMTRAQQFTNDPNLILVFNAISGVLNKCLLKFDGQQVMEAMQDAVATFPPPPMPQPMPGQPPMGGPGIPPPGNVPFSTEPIQQQIREHGVGIS